MKWWHLPSRSSERHKEKNKFVVNKIEKEREFFGKKLNFVEFFSFVPLENWCWVEQQGHWLALQAKYIPRYHAKTLKCFWASDKWRNISQNVLNWGSVPSSGTEWPSSGTVKIGIPNGQKKKCHICWKFLKFLSCCFGRECKNCENFGGCAEFLSLWVTIRSFLGSSKKNDFAWIGVASHKICFPTSGTSESNANYFNFNSAKKLWPEVVNKKNIHKFPSLSRYWEVLSRFRKVLLYRDKILNFGNLTVLQEKFLHLTIVAACCRHKSPACV